MAEQAINTIFLLGDQPDALCASIIRDLTRKAFSAQIRSERVGSPVKNKDVDEQMSQNDEDPAQITNVECATEEPPAQGNAFLMSQLIFVVGHVAIKQIVHLELVERECKKQKDDQEKSLFTTPSRFRQLMSISDKSTTKTGNNDLQEITGNAEDDIGENISAIRENELLFGTESLLALYGDMVVEICSKPKSFPVREVSSEFVTNTHPCASIRCFERPQL